MAVQTGRDIFDMKTMSATEIAQMVAGAQPTSSGNDAAIEEKRYSALASAAQTTVKDRETDPVTYVRDAFPSVRQAWQDVASGTGDMASAIAKTVSAQHDLGIRNVEVLPKEIAEQSVARFKMPDLSDEDRLRTVTSAVFATKEPSQQRAIFDQLVDTGLPPMIEGAIEASARGDEGAAHRLMQAAIVDTKNLPHLSTIKPKDITATIYSTVWAHGEVGDVAYGVSYGDASSLERMQRGTDLLNRAVQVRISQGESLQTAVNNAKRDLFGDVKVYNGAFYGRAYDDENPVHGELVIPAGTNMSTLTQGLQRVKSDFALALADQRDRVAGRTNTKASDGTKAIFDATTHNRMNDIINNGVFVRVGYGIGLRDPYTGSFVTDVDGKTPLSISLVDILKLGEGATPFDKSKAKAVYGAGMRQIEGWATPPTVH